MTKSADLRVQASRHYKSCPGKNKISVKALYGVNPRTVRRWNAKQGDAADGGVGGQNNNLPALPMRKRKLKGRGIPDNHWPYLAAIFRMRCRLTWEEASCWLVPMIHVKYTARQIETACTSRKWNRKEVHSSPRQRDEDLRGVFREVIRAFSAPQLVFLDETHKKGKDCMRSTGVAPAGERPVDQVDGLFMRQSTSCLAAVSICGTHPMCSIDTTEIKYDTDLFCAKLEHVILPTMNAFPQPRSVLCLDNARIHNKLRIYQLCSARGILVFFLPPYSFDYSPAELVFNSAKTLMRKTYGIDTRGLSLLAIFEDSIFRCLDTNQLCNTFEHCFLHVTAAERLWAHDERFCL